MFTGEGIAYLAIVLFFAVVIFAAIREIVLWYFKLNHIAQQLDIAVSILSRATEALERISPQPTVVPPATNLPSIAQTQARPTKSLTP